MLTIGDYNTLRITKRVDFGLYLDGGETGEILLPQRYVTPDMHIGDEIEVFLYLDHDERIVATTEHPIAKVGEFAWLECAWTNEYGAFLRWGLMKDLFCPFREQKQRMERGRTYYVYIMEDTKTHRLMATAKVERYQKTTGRQRALDFAEQLLRHLHENDGSSPSATTAYASYSQSCHSVSRRPVSSQHAELTGRPSSYDLEKNCISGQELQRKIERKEQVRNILYFYLI